MDFLSSHEARLGISLAIGLLIGAERERRQAEQKMGFAGLRTFGLVALLGGLFAYLESPPLMVTGAAIVGLIAVVGYVVNRHMPDRGITTEIALVVTYGLGLLAMDHPVLAPGAAVVVTWLLALRGELHKLVQKTITERELRDALVFLLFALVVLPIAPNEPLGPYNAINPQLLVRLVVVLMAVTSAGYLAQRLLSARLGLAFTGFLAGFISSSATIGAMSLRARDDSSRWQSAAAGGLSSSLATLVQYAIVIAAVNPGLLVQLTPVLGAAAVAALIPAGAFSWLALRQEEAPAPPGRPFELAAALGFGLVFSLVSVAAAALKERLGAAGIVLVSAVAALIDAHSTSGSVASLHQDGSIDTATARLAIATALSANSLTKIALAWSGRHLKYGVSVTLGVLLIAIAAWLGLLLAPP